MSQARSSHRNPALVKQAVLVGWVLGGLLVAERTAACAWGQPSRAAKAAAGQSAARQPGAADWPRFRGPLGTGISQAAALPVAWDADQHVRWKTRLPGAGSSSPIVWDDQVYVTCYSGYLVPGEARGTLDALQRHLVCLRRSDGKLLWQRAVKARLPEEESIRDHGYAGNTPVAAAEGVYVFFGKSGVHAFDHAGKLRWSADVGAQTSGWGSAASPILQGDLLIVNAGVESESLVALDRRTGAERWRAGGIKESWNTPLIVTTPTGKEELVVAVFGKVLGFDPATGKQLWECATDITWYMVPSAVAAEGVVYFLGGRSGTAALAVRAGGRGDVTATHRLWTSTKGSNVTSPVYHGGHLYWVHEKLGIAYCARADTGELVYEQRLNRGGQVYASALLAGGRLYYLNRSGRTFVLAAKPAFELLATNELGDGSVFDGSPAASGDWLLVRSNKYLYCLGN